METSKPNFLSLSLKDLEKKNLRAKKLRSQRQDLDKKEIEKKYKKYLKEENDIKAITIFFSDLQGRFHMIDYDKKYLLDASDNLTFDGSSVQGFSNVNMSDLRLKPDWASFYWLPATIFGPGKIALFADIYTRENEIHPCDFRARLKTYVKELAKKDLTVNIGAEIEGFLLEGKDAETKYTERKGFKLVSPGGYYHSLPKDKLRLFIDSTAEIQRALGFENEKDHPEVAPSQFELNYKYADAINAADQIQLYKLVARQVAENIESTACFLPKPLTNINGSGMHTNISISKKNKNIFYDTKKKEAVSTKAIDFTKRILSNAGDLCLILNSSVNSYRRLDPNYEAPNKIICSHSDRTAMIRLPVGNEHSTRIEVRSIAPDTNPYLLIYSLLKVGLEGTKEKEDKNKRSRTKYLPGNIYDSLRIFKASDLITELMGEESKSKYAELKEMVANRSPKELGKVIKKSEIIYHHEITNQYLWNRF